MPKRISLQLSKEQQEQIKQATGDDAEAIELTAEELEARITPSINSVSLSTSRLYSLMSSVVTQQMQVGQGIVQNLL